MRMKILLLALMIFSLFGCSEKETTVLINFEAGVEIVIEDHVFVQGETLPVAHKEGHTFLGWFTSENENAPMFNWEDVTEEEITLYAKWEVKDYQIRFFDWDFSLVETWTRAYGQTLDSHRPEGEFERAEHLFYGWQPLPETMPARDLDIYALYVPVQFKEVANPYSLTEIVRDVRVYQDYFIFHTFDVYKDIINIFKIDDPEYKRTIILAKGQEEYLNGIICQDGYLILPSYSEIVKEGSIDIYKFSDENYHKTLRAPEGDIEFFGRMWDDEDVYLYHHHLMVRAYNREAEKGVLYVYDFNNRNTPRVITSSDPDLDRFFGLDIKTSNNLIITKAYNRETGEGEVYVYDILDEAYERIITGSDVEAGDGFAQTVVVVDDYILVNAIYQDNERGALYIYHTDDEAYERKLTTTDPGSEGRFGYRFFVKDDYLVVSDIESSYLDEIHLFKFSDEDYHRVIDETDLPDDIGDRYLWDTKPLGDYFVVYAKNPVIPQSPQTEIYLFSYEDEEYVQLIDVYDNDYTSGSFLKWYDISDSGELLLLERYDSTAATTLLYNIYEMPAFNDLGELLQISIGPFEPGASMVKNLYFNDDLYLIYSLYRTEGRILIFDLDNNNLSHILENDGTISNYGLQVFFVEDYLFVFSGYNGGNVYIYDLSSLMNPSNV